MLSAAESSLIYKHAYLPEHLPDYIAAVSEAEPFLHQGYLCLFKRGHLTFIGYSLGPGEIAPSSAYESACRRFGPRTASIIAPEIWLPADTYESEAVDEYFRLDLPIAKINADPAYMVRRAEKELSVVRGTWGKAHRHLVKEFITNKRLPPAYKKIFKKIPVYLKQCNSAVLLEARKGPELAAFNIMDTGAARYAFWLFNFRSEKMGFPGASDLLFYEMTRLAQAEGKTAMNLGLGLNPGVRRFKRKWGGAPFLPYTSTLVRGIAPDLDSVYKKL